MTKPFRHFFTTVKESVYSPSFYSKVQNLTFGQALLYQLKLHGLIYGILAIVGILFILFFSGLAPETLQPILDKIYPNELELTIQDGELSSNVQEPYFIQVPGEWKSGPEAQESFQNIAVIDTTTPFSLDAMHNYDAAVWISKEAVFTLQENGKMQAIDLTKAPNAKINREQIDYWTGKLLHAFKPILVVAIIFAALAATFGVLLFRLFYNLFLALFVWILAKLMRVEWNYGTSYIAGLHLMTLSILLGLLLFLIPGVGGFKFLFTLVALLVAGINMNGMKSLKAPSTRKKAA